VLPPRKDLQRSRTLVNQFFETKQVVDQQQAKVDQVIAMVDAIGPRETAQTNLDYTSIMVDQASATMRMKADFSSFPPAHSVLAKPLRALVTVKVPSICAVTLIQ
jgi:hypothetical protein